MPRGGVARPLRARRARRFRGDSLIVPARAAVERKNWLASSRARTAFGSTRARETITGTAESRPNASPRAARTAACGLAVSSGSVRHAFREGRATKEDFEWIGILGTIRMRWCCDESPWTTRPVAAEPRKATVPWLRRVGTGPRNMRRRSSLEENANLVHVTSLHWMRLRVADEASSSLFDVSRTPSSQYREWERSSR